MSSAKVKKFLSDICKTVGHDQAAILSTCDRCGYNPLAIDTMYTFREKYMNVPYVAYKDIQIKEDPTDKHNFIVQFKVQPITSTDVVFITNVIV